MARPKLDGPVVRVPLTLSLRVGEDDDLIEFFARNDRKLNVSRAAYVMAALRAGGMTNNGTEHAEDDSKLGDILGGLMF